MRSQSSISFSSSPSTLSRYLFDLEAGPSQLPAELEPSVEVVPDTAEAVLATADTVWTTDESAGEIGGLTRVVARRAVAEERADRRMTGIVGLLARMDEMSTSLVEIDV